VSQEVRTDQKGWTMFQELIKSDATALDELKKARIIIADEHAHEQGSLYQMLLETGCTNLISNIDQNEIIKLLREGYRKETQQIDLLILSTSIETFDALQLCQTLSHHDITNTPIILLSQGNGWLDENQLTTTYKAGAIDLLIRPLRIAEAIPRINLALRYRSELKKRVVHEENLTTELSERRVMESRLNYLLNHDELTSLLSRHRLEAALKISLGKSKTLHRTFALIYIDVDNFRILNDTMGHERGDKLLVRLSDLLRESTPEKTLIARIGSDEFGILLDGADEHVAMDLAHLINNKLDDLLCGETGNQITINASIGVVMIDPGTDNKTASEVLARGDQACHIAKEQNENRIYLFNHNDAEIKSLQKIRQSVGLVKKAISNDWFDLYLQPIVNLADESTSHYEVLIRLTDDQGVTHSPEYFIPAAEISGLIHKIDFWVVDHALSLLETLPSHINLSINLSAEGLQSPALLELIKDKIDFCSLNPSRIMFEITETAAVKNVQLTRQTITKLRAIGCRFAIDDFGTGFSSFNYIKNYPVDFIKIDGIFITQLVDEPSDQILVKSMVDIAHSLGKKVIAEYVENAETVELLKEYSVDYVQGFFFGKPVPTKQLF